MNYKIIAIKTGISIIVSLIIVSTLFGFGSMWKNIALTSVIYSILYTFNFDGISVLIEQKINSSKNTNQQRFQYFAYLSLTAFGVTISGQLITVSLNLVPFSFFIFMILIVITSIIIPIFKGFKIYRKVSL